MLIDAWANVFGREAMNIRIFEPEYLIEGDLLADFCALAGIDRAGLTSPDIENPSVTAVAQSFLRVANQKLPSILPGGDFNHARGPLNMALIKHFSGRPPLPARREAEHFYDYFRASNERLRARYLPGTEAPLFAEDFSTYPETSEEQQLSFEDGANLAVTLWSEAQGEIARLKEELAKAKRVAKAPEV
ncbi:hypothetical protein [Halovulum sp. GXIMD14793]